MTAPFGASLASEETASATIRLYGIPLLEGLELKPLAAHGRETFLFVAAPLPVVGGTGSPLAPVAVL